MYELSNLLLTDFESASLPVSPPSATSPSHPLNEGTSHEPPLQLPQSPSSQASFDEAFDNEASGGESSYSSPSEPSEGTVPTTSYDQPQDNADSSKNIL